MAQIFGVFGHGLIKNNALLQAFLQSYIAKNSDKNLDKNANNSVKIARIFPVISDVKPDTIMLGWGRKKSYRRASRFAQAHDLAMLTLEDGFLRSLTSGKNSRHACSMVIDSIGIYFNAKYPSYLEQLIAKSYLNSEQIQTAQRLIQRITNERLSKYNGTPKSGTLTALNIQKDVKNILLIDQVAGDQSINGAGADKDSFVKMLQIAEQNHPNAQLWVKAHPAGNVGYLTQIDLPNDVKIIRDHVNPIELLEQMDEVYTVSSHMGFEALMQGKPVHCFGVAWYAGWGLTDDSHAPQNVLAVAQNRRYKARQKMGLPNATLADLFYACYLQYAHYANPATAKACDIDTAIDWLVTNRTWKDKFTTHAKPNPAPLLVYEFSGWKQGFVKAFFASSGRKLVFKAKPKMGETYDFFTPNKLLSKLPSGFDKLTPNGKLANLVNFDNILVWGFAKKQQVQSQLENSSLPQPHFVLRNSVSHPKVGGNYQEIWCMEDGFIRSNGLGASLIEPLSVVVDKTGIYYDATAPSDLEILLANQNALNQEHLTRLENLQQRLLSQQVSKYNVGESKPLILPTSSANKEKILVVGQVEDDLSIQRCASDIKTNLGLLKQVRQDKPSAFILYKPHPDVQAGLRVGKIADSDMANYADQIVPDIRMPECLEKVDSVHTISSLTGFEALLRGKKVTCYGLPFYAGWGLTEDKANNDIANQTLERRKIYREKNQLPPLTLAQLIYATLIDYPLYRLPSDSLSKSHGLAQAEDVIDFLYSHTNVEENSLANQKMRLPKNIFQAKQPFNTQFKPLIKQQKTLLATKFMRLRHQVQAMKQKKR